MKRDQRSWLLKGLWLLVIVPFVLSCDRKEEGRSASKHQVVAQRAGDYRKSYFFDQSLMDLTKGFEQWNHLLVQTAEIQSTSDKQPIILSSLELILPILREAQRGFFKKTPSGWRKAVEKSERLSLEKEIFVEKIEVDVAETNNLPEKELSWTLVASGRFPKDQTGELFVIRWNAPKHDLSITSRLNPDKPLSCSLTFSFNNEVKNCVCENVILYRVENKDITIEHLNYDLKKGFESDGSFKNAKGVSVKWGLHSSQSSVLTPLSGADQ